MNLLSKSLILLMISFNLAAQVEYDQNEIEIKTRVSVMNLNCIVPNGDHSRIYTELSRLMILNSNQFEFEFNRVSIKGCESEIISEIVNNSHNSFGFIDVELKIINNVANNPRFVFGKCQRNIQQQIVLNFNEKLFLSSSRLGKLIPAIGCKIN